MMMKTTNAIIAILYGAFLSLSFLYFILAGSAIVDYTGIDKHLPSQLTSIIVALISSLLFTALSSIPLVLTKRKGIRKAVFVLFLVSFTFYSIIVWFFLGFK
ncbi:MAG: hypothetical protein J7L37_09765 [Thermococcus sp.]|nr:hypothetical protein [Thermococcus sp.]